MYNYIYLDIWSYSYRGTLTETGCSERNHLQQCHTRWHIAWRATKNSEYRRQNTYIFHIVGTFVEKKQTRKSIETFMMFGYVWMMHLSPPPWTAVPPLAPLSFPAFGMLHVGLTKMAHAGVIAPVTKKNPRLIRCYGCLLVFSLVSTDDIFHILFCLDLY